MKTSTDRILTTHVGSLPLPPDLLAQSEARELAETVDETAFAARLAAAVRDVVAQQMAAGIDSVCDGEQSMGVPSIAWAKLTALAQGARVASDRLWR